MEGINNSVGSENPPSQQLPAVPSPSPPPPLPEGFASPSTVAGEFPGKKKRGRPRKYAADGSVLPLSPKPISTAAPPPVIDFSAGNFGKVRAVGLIGSKQQTHRLGVESLGDWVSCSVGASFTPHVLTVNTGEDVMTKVISFSQQGPQAICILSANGIISSVTLSQPDSSGGTLTYEGCFEILSLTGSFTPSEKGGIRNRTGGMSVSLAGPDGRVMGGCVAGLLVAATPVQIVIGSFLAGNQLEPSNKKPKIHTIITPITSTEIEDTYSGDAPHIITAPKPNISSSLSFGGDNWSIFSSTDSRNKKSEINSTLFG